MVLARKAILTVMPRRVVDLSTHLDTRPTRFVLVGATGVAVSTAVLETATRLGISTTWGGLLAAVISTCTNFLLNDAFTWRDRRSPGLRMKALRLLRYYSTTAAGNVIYLAVLTALVHRVGLYQHLANILAIGVGGTFNYLLHNVWTWKRRPER